MEADNTYDFSEQHILLYFIQNKEKELEADPELVKKLFRDIKKQVPAKGPEGIVICGHLPLWIYSTIIYYFRQRPWVALCYFIKNFRCQSVVVYRNKRKAPKVGKVIWTINYPKVVIVKPKRQRRKRIESDQNSQVCQPVDQQTSSQTNTTETN